MTHADLPALTRRRILVRLIRSGLAAALAATLSGLHVPALAAAADSAPVYPPIVFVHGNGDNAASWTTTVWRFESNGWPRERLFAVDLPYPLARDDDTKEQPGRSSSTEQRATLAAEVDRVLAATGARQVVLMGNSRGGLTIRNYIANAGGAAKVSHAILAGTPNHGVWALPNFRPGNEFNGAGPFLKALNAPRAADGSLLPLAAAASSAGAASATSAGASGATSAAPAGLEITPGPKWLTLRSDGNDKYAQPDGSAIGAKGMKTHVTAEGPALAGAENLVLPERDHRETAFHRDAFQAAWRFLTGRQATVDITPEAAITLDGKVTGVSGAGPTNLPVPGAQLTVYAIDPATGQRRGQALLQKTVGEDGRWGPLKTDSKTHLEFVIEQGGNQMAVTHIFRSPFARSSSVVHLRPERMLSLEVGARAVVIFSRPRGYFGLPRDTVLLDGQGGLPGLSTGVATAAQSRSILREGDRKVVGQFRSGAIDETVVGWAWPAGKDKVVTVLELHH